MHAKRSSCSPIHEKLWRNSEGSEAQIHSSVEKGEEWEIGNDYEIVSPIISGKGASCQNSEDHGAKRKEKIRGRRDFRGEKLFNPLLLTWG